MKKKAIMAVCMAMTVSALAGACAAASTASIRIGHVPDGICTRDFNLWGHASSCNCDEGAVYDDRAGLCLEGEESEKIIVQGAISAGMAAIGGETTGFLIETSEAKSFELILKLEDQQKLTKLSGLWFEIEGEPIIIESVEMKHRQVLIVDVIRVLE